MVEVSKSFALECEEIDKDHRRLSEMVNEIVALLETGETTGCKEKVQAFVTFMKQHFEREEEILRQQGYPDLENHQAHHATLDQKMDHILEFADMAVVNEKARESLKKELVYFLMDDVISTDLSFKPYVSEH